MGVRCYNSSADKHLALRAKGRLAERFKAPVLKTGRGASLS